MRSTSTMLLALVLATTTLLVPTSSQAADPGVRTVAVLPMEQGAGGEAYVGLGTALAGMLVTDLSSAPGLQLVERQKLGALLAEMKLAASGLLDPTTAQRLGRGLGAELIVTGSFSVVKGTFLMDARVVGVERGAVVKAANASGEVADFIAVVKGVVEELLDGLSVKLSLAARRKLLMRAPTENVEAFAQYGQGVEALDLGDLPTAKEAFEAALKTDPTFATAATALAALNTRLTQLETRSRDQAADARTRSIEGALAALTAETARPPGFVHDWRSIRDLSVRQALLALRGRHCERYQELAAFLERTNGRWTPWYDHFSGTEHRERWRAASDDLDAYGRTLGLVGRGTYFGTRPGELMHLAGNDLASAKRVLLFGNTSPEKFRDTLVRSLERCFPPAGQIAEWDRWEAWITAHGLGAEPLWTVYKQGPSTVTVADGAVLYGAYLRAKHNGVTAQVTARTEAVVARHPEGDPDRRNVLSRVREIVQAAQGRERRLASRHGRTGDALAELADGIAREDAKRVRLSEGLCRQLVAADKEAAAEAHAKWAGLARDAKPRDWDRAVDRLGDVVATVVMAGCEAGARGAVRVDTVQQLIRVAADRRHPDLLEDARCQKDVTTLLQQLGDAKRWQGSPQRQASMARSALLSLYRLRTRRCLLP